MKIPLLALVLTALLSACAIPYETPEARANIELDLKLSANEIVTIEQTNSIFARFIGERLRL